MNGRGSSRSRTDECRGYPAERIGLRQRSRRCRSRQECRAATAPCYTADRAGAPRQQRAPGKRESVQTGWTLDFNPRVPGSPQQGFHGTDSPRKRGDPFRTDARPHGAAQPAIGCASRRPSASSNPRNRDSSVQGNPESLNPRDAGSFLPPPPPWAGDLFFHGLGQGEAGRDVESPFPSAEDSGIRLAPCIGGSRCPGIPEPETP